MNRILVYLQDGASSAERKRLRLKAALAHIEKLSGGIVSVFITPDGIPTFHIASDLDDENCCGVEIPDVNAADSFVAAELRKFAARCLVAADSMEGGAA